MHFWEKKSKVFRFLKGLDQRRDKAVDWSSSHTGPLPNKILAASGMGQNCMAITPCKMGNSGYRGGPEEIVLQ